jgi:hypothetical protein
MIHPLAKATVLLGATLFLPVLSAQEKESSPAAPAGSHVLATRGAAPAPGTTFTTTRIFAYDHFAMKLTAGGKVTEGTVLRKETTVETLEGLDAGKMRRTLTSSRSDGEVTMNGQKSRPPQKLDSLLETPVILRRAKGSWIAELEKGEAFRNQKHSLESLEKSFNRDPAFAAYGEEPRKPGDKWKVDLGAFSPEVFGEFAEMENIGGTFTLELLAVTQEKGTPIAKLKAVLDLKGTPKGSTAGTFTFKGEGEILRSLRDQVDLGWRYKAAVTIDAPGDEAAGTPATQLSGPYLISGTTTVKRP